MKLESILILGRWPIGVLAGSAFLGIVLLAGFGYRATQEWQRSSELLVTREMEDGADLLALALQRDMRDVQSRVLANRDWAESSASLADTSTQVAGAFARYPYPESFFTWQKDDPRVVFFHRADRYPEWMPPDSGTQTYPVIISFDPPAVAPLRRRIDQYASSHIRYVALNTSIDDQPYQVIARLVYADPLQIEPESVLGFTVNLGWVRGAYFAELFSQVMPIASRGAGLDIGILDEQGQAVWGTVDGSRPMVREFPLLFLDPSVGKVALDADGKVRRWRLLASPPRSAVALAAKRADQSLLLVSIAAFPLCVGLFLSMRAVQKGVRLAALRSDFVSSVTHDLKMPLANIRALADTLALRSVPPERIQTYSRHLKHEATRLTRLVENLLAYARVTDVANVYSFEPIVPARLIKEVLQGFRQPLAERQFAVQIKVPDDLPLVRADRSAMHLALENLIDNAIRYSGETRALDVSAEPGDRMVTFVIEDHGIGITPEELVSVRRKFVRGRSGVSTGTGLGLTIVGRIVADHGGTFTIESEYGRGTVARVTLPVSEDESG
jgi:signal transduction histidine kinase